MAEEIWRQKGKSRKKRAIEKQVGMIFVKYFSILTYSVFSYINDLNLPGVHLASFQCSGWMCLNGQ